MTKKVTSKPVTFLLATKSAAAPCVLVRRKRCGIWHPSTPYIAGESLMTSSMIVSSSVAATPVRRRSRSISHSHGDVVGG
jgi:hypothetical protein